MRRGYRGVSNLAIMQRAGGYIVQGGRAHGSRTPPSKVDAVDVYTREQPVVFSTGG